MVQSINLRLIFSGFLAVFCAFLTISDAFSQPVNGKNGEDAPVKQPPGQVRQEEIPPLDLNQATVFIELFSSQACVFCPQADKLFAHFLEQSHILGISCHIDYFDVEQKSLSKPFCTERQNWYMDVLRAGPNYTPQMVMNGRYDVVGHKTEDIENTLKKAKKDGILPIGIKSGEGKGFILSLPEIKTDKNSNITLWMVLYDKRHELNISGGRNRGKAMNYMNIADKLEDLGAWNGEAQEKILKLEFSNNHKGFVILAQDKSNGHILAVGDYIFQ